MSLAGLVSLVAADPSIAAASALGVRATLSWSRQGGDGADHRCTGLRVANRPRPVLAVTATTREADDLVAALGSLLDPATVADFPSWETLPHERLSPRTDTVGRRIAVLRRLAHPETATTPVPAPCRSWSHRCVRSCSPSWWGSVTSSRCGCTSATRSMWRRPSSGWSKAGTCRADIVERRGEFAVRGGILDIFPAVEEHPLRVELWGDTVEEIRWFKAADQRSLEIAPHGVWAPPTRELPLTDEVRARAAALLAAAPWARRGARPARRGHRCRRHGVALTRADRRDAAARRRRAGSTPSVVVVDPERVRARSVELHRTSEEFLAASWANAAAGNVTPIDLGAASYRELVDVEAAARRRRLRWFGVGPFGSLDEDADRSTLRPSEEYHGDIDRAVAAIAAAVKDGWRVVLVTAGHGPAERFAERLREDDVAAEVVAEVDLARPPSVVQLTTGVMEHGLVSEELKLLVLTETDLVGQRSSTKDMRRMPSRRRATVDPLQLAPGDFIVHEQHGVGRYVEMTSREVQGATREYLVIEYAPARKGQPADRLFVPTDQLDLVTRYVGGEAPSLHRLGGADWAKTKGRARKAVKQIAAELVRLYSARQSAPGYAFGPDTPWQRELEDAFPYVETPDQMACIDEVKARHGAAGPHGPSRLR